MLKIALADDHQIVLDGLRHMLQTDSGIRIVGESLNGGELIALLLQNEVDVALVDIDMPDMNGIAACREIRRKFPATRVIALTMMDEPSIIRQMLDAGASGYLMKNTGKSELLDAIRIVAAGGSYYSEEVAAKIFQQNDNDNPGDEGAASLPRLSRREKEILKLIIAEMTTAEIADKLHISFGTVETHRRNIMNKLGARNVVDMVRIALENNLLDKG